MHFFSCLNNDLQHPDFFSTKIFYFAVKHKTSFVTMVLLNSFFIFGFRHSLHLVKVKNYGLP